MTKTNKTALTTKIEEANSLLSSLYDRLSKEEEAVSDEKQKLQQFSERANKAYAEMNAETFVIESENARRSQLKIDMLKKASADNAAIAPDKAKQLSEDILEYLEGYEEEALISINAEYEALIKKLVSFKEEVNMSLQAVEALNSCASGAVALDREALLRKVKYDHGNDPASVFLQKINTAYGDNSPFLLGDKK